MLAAAGPRSGGPGALVDAEAPCPWRQGFCLRLPLPSGGEFSHVTVMEGASEIWAGNGDPVHRQAPVLPVNVPDTFIDSFFAPVFMIGWDSFEQSEQLAL